MKFTQFLKNEFRKSRIKQWKKLYDKPHHIKAQKAIKALKLQGRSLSDQQIKLCDDYALEILGSKDFSLWLQVYTAFSGEFREGWIPDNYLGRVICPAINGDLKSVGQYKTLTNKLLQTDALPDLTYFIKGFWLSKDGHLSSIESIHSACFDQYPYVFLKKDFSLQGNGVVKLDEKKFKEFDFKGAGDFVIQAPIFQHPALEEFSPGAVATLRITTVKPIGQPAKNKLCGLRIGRKGMDFIYTKDCIRVPIWPEDGLFFQTATSPDWAILEKHPDTGAFFDGKSVPNFLDAVSLCESLHDQNPHFQLIGWDATIDRDGTVKLMEWNLNEPGIVFSEAATGPHFIGLGWENLWKTKNPRG